MPKLLPTLLFLLLFTYCSDPLSEEGANQSTKQKLPIDTNVMDKADAQDLKDWKVITAINKLYFTTSDPVNKSESLDKNLRFYYYYVDLLGEEKNVNEYRPVDGM